MNPIRFSLIVFLVLMLPMAAFAQTDTKQKEPRILVLLDGSSSMLQDWQGEGERFKAAGNIVLTLIDSVYKINNQAEFALRVYGHQHTTGENNCYDTRKEVKFSKDNYTQMALRLASIRPLGVSPIAYSLKQAAENDLTETDDYNYTIVLITDGGESCEGDICAVVRELLDKKINFRPYIISLIDYDPLKQEYDCLGNFLQVTKRDDIPKAVSTIVSSYRKMLLTPTARAKEIQKKMIAPPSGLKVSIPKVVVKEPEPEPVASPPPPVVIPKETFEYIRLPRPVSMKRYRIDSQPVFAIAVPPIAKYVPEPVAPSPPPAPKPQPKTTVVTRPVTTKPVQPAKATPVEVITETKPASETQLKVYFTDGNGKYYSTTPEVLLNDPKTGKTINSFYRTIDAMNEPRPQKVAAGLYNITFSGKTSLVVKNQTIEAGKLNIVKVIVGKSSLVFRYEGNPDRPIDEYYALVKKTLEPGPIMKQLGTEEKEYEPGNYHIEFNTMPPDVRNVDLEFQAVVYVDISEPGFVEFANTNNIGKIELYYPLGDRYVLFHRMNITGDPASQKLQLRPLRYEVHYMRNAGQPNAEKVVEVFYVRSNAITNITLR